MKYLIFFLIFITPNVQGTFRALLHNQRTRITSGQILITGSNKNVVSVNHTKINKYPIKLQSSSIKTKYVVATVAGFYASYMLYKWLNPKPKVVRHKFEENK